MHIATHGHWSLGTLLAFPLGVLAIVALLVVAVVLLVIRRTADRYDRGIILAFAIGSFVAALVALLIVAFGMYPYKAEYHQWRDVSGVVATTNSRLIAGDHATDQKFVVSFVGAPDKQFGCNDTRCAGVRPGDHLTITCKRTWQWFGTPGYDCNFVSLEAK